MTAPSRIEINQIALDPCGPSTHDNAHWVLILFLAIGTDYFTR